MVVSASGLNGSFFTSELTLTNRGNHDAILRFAYVPAFGGGGGSASDVLPAGRQEILPDAIAYLKSIGIPILGTGAEHCTWKAPVSALLRILWQQFGRRLPRPTGVPDWPMLL
jgi:hypothetical protein